MQGSNQRPTRSNERAIRNSESYKYGTDEKQYMKGHFKGFTLVMEVVSNPP